MNLADICFINGLASGNVLAVQELSKERYLQRDLPDRHMLSNVWRKQEKSYFHCKNGDFFQIFSCVKVHHST